MHHTANPTVLNVIAAYPAHVSQKLDYLRQLIIETAQETDGLTALEETLKWGEPAYLTKHGSTIRIDWKKKKPEQYAIYFKCTSKLVDTFKQLYGDVFKYETTRAIFFKFEEQIPEQELKHCIQLALTYHKVKHLPLLGTGY